MINPKDFYDELLKNNADFFVGVPDSTIKNFTAFLDETNSTHIIAANEGNAVALGVGYHLATSKIPVIYMQNSGLTNASSPLISLSDSDVYHTPMLLLIGYRGEPGTKDEPQHKKQGKITLKMLECMDIKCEVLEINNYQTQIQTAYKYILKTNKTYALVISKNTFESFSGKKEKGYELDRSKAIEAIVKNTSKNDVFVSTTGHISRELYEFRLAQNSDLNQDFMCVGSMGHASSIALGIALQKPHLNVFCLDGDGAFLMHSGAVGVIASKKPKNYKHIIFNNKAHDSVGSQKTCSENIDYKSVFLGFGYKNYFLASNENEIDDVLNDFINATGPCILEVKVACRKNKELLRPKETPIENKIKFMEFLKNV